MTDKTIRDQDDVPLIDVDHGLPPGATGNIYTPQPKPRRRINWFVIILCLATLAWCAYRAWTIHAAQVRP